MSAVLACAVPDELLSALIERLGVDPAPDTTTCDPDVMLERLRSGGETDAVLVGPATREPLTVAQQVHLLDRDIPVVILVPPERVPEVSLALRFTPFIGDVAVALRAEVDEDVVAALRNVVEAARRRRHYLHTIAALNETASGMQARQPATPQYLGQLFEQAPAGVLMLNEDGAIASANRRVADVLGVAQTEILGRPFDELFSAPEDARLLRQVALKEAIGPALLMRSWEDRDQVLEVTFGPAVGRLGEPAVLALVNDVTAAMVAERERRRAEETLRYQTSLLTAQSEASFEGILVVGTDGQILSSNRRFGEMWQIPEEVVASRSDEAALNAVLDKLSDPEHFLSRVRYLYDHPQETSIDRLELRDGRTFERYSAPVRGADGRHYGRVWFFQDITERLRRERQLRFLADAGQIFAETLETQTMLERLASLCVRDLADWCGVYVVDEQGVTRVAATTTAGRNGVDEALVALSAPDAPAPPRVLGAIRRRRADLRLETTARSALDDLDGTAERGAHASICAPIVRGRRVLGAILLTNAARRYDEHDLLLAEDLGRRAALAMQNATLFEQRSHVAKVLQQSLLPPVLPTVSGLEIGQAYSAAGEAYDVGGDFYDLFFTGDDRWAVIIGDVCGKGPLAASLTALARYVVRGAALQSGEPAAVLSLLNQAVYRERGGEMFCTATYAIVERAGDGFRLRLARGGHPPLLVVRAGGDVEAIEPEGSLLGVLPEVHLEEAEVVLAPGDTAVLFTDGVTEARGVEQRYGFERLRALVAKLAGRPAPEIATAIERDVNAYSRGQADDDVAILTLRAVRVREPVAVTPSEERHLSLDPSRSSPSEARRFVRAVAGEWGLLGLEDELVLLTDELVTNAVLHAATRIEVVVRRENGHVRVEVHDEAEEMPAVAESDTEATGGRGLYLVEALAERWGAQPEDRGKAVWFEMPVR